MADLPPNPPILAAVEVVVPRLPAAASDAAFSVITLDAADIEGRQRIDQVLSQAPGVSLFRRNSSIAANPTTQGISLRSIAPTGAGRALVTLDGVPQNDPFGGWVIWAGLPPELIESISLVRGGGAGPYGAGALTGVINLAERSRDGIEVDLRGGELGFKRGAVVYETQANGYDFLLAGSASETDGYIPVRQGRGAADTALSARDWNVVTRLSGEVGSSLFSLRLSAFDEDRESGLVGAAARATGESASLTLGRAPGVDSLGYRLQAWARRSNLENSSVAVSADRSTTTPANDQFKTPAEGYGLNGAIRGGGRDREWELGADVRATTGETRELFRFMGGEFTRTRVAGGDTLVAGVYGEGTLTRGPWLLTGGARVDRWSSSDAKRLETDRANGAVTVNAPSAGQDGWLPTARAGVRRELGQGLYVRSAGYVGFRPPTLNELHRPFRVGNDITEANAALEPEKLYGIEAAFGFQSGATQVSATLFYNELQDAVTNVTIAEGPGTIVGFESAGFIPAGGVLRQRRNAGTIEAVGVEVEAEHSYSDALALRLAASYTDAEVDGGLDAPQLTGLRPAQAPRTTVTASVNWRPLEPLRLDLRARYESERFDDDLNSRVLKEATVVDLRAGWRITPAVEIYAIGENLFDADVQTAVTGTGIASYGTPRTFSIGLNYRM